MKVSKTAITLKPTSTFIGLFFLLSSLLSFGQSNVERINNSKIVDGSIVISAIETFGETATNQFDGSIEISFIDVNRVASTYSVIYELHESGNYQLVQGLPYVDGGITINKARNAEYFGFQVVRDVDYIASARSAEQKNVKHAVPVPTSNANQRTSCSGTFTDCAGVSRSFSNLQSDAYYNSSASYRPCGFYLDDNCSVSENARWHCIDGNLSSPGQYTEYSYVSTNYAGVGLTALQASRLNWVVCNYDYNGSGVASAIWAITGTGGSQNSIYNAAVAAVPTADGSADQVEFFKSTVASVQDMIKWECKSTCTDEPICKIEIDGVWNYNTCDATICLGSEIELGIGSAPSNNITWSGPNGFSASGNWQTITTSATSDVFGTYTATIVNGGCTYSKTFNLSLADNCLDPIDGWYYECGDDKKIDEYGYNANCKTSTTATIPNPGNVYQYVVELVYKGGNPGNAVQFTDASNNTYTLLRSVPFGSSSNIWVYRGLVSGSTSSVTYNNSSNTCHLQSLVVYAYRNDPNATAGSGIYTNMSGYNDVQTITIDIPTDNGPRDLVIETPISEMTTDGRYLMLSADAGGVTDQVFVYGPDASLPGGTCCLTIPTLTLNNVAGNVSQVVLTIDTRHRQNGQSVNGQSWVIAGGVNVDVECFECDLEADAGDDVEICVGESTIVSGIKTGGTAPFTYSWDLGLGDGQTHTVSPSTTTTYTLVVTDANGCEATDKVIVTVNPLPEADAGDDVEICKGESTTLTATGGDSYLWSTGATTQSITVSPNSTTTYTVTVTSSENCVATDDVKVTVNNLPTANAGPDKEICKGETVTLTASGGGSYLWSTGATTQSITVSPNSTTSYTVTVTTSKGCSDSDEAIVTVNPLPILNAGDDVSICIGESTTLSANASGGNAPYTFEWDNGLGAGQSHQVSPTSTTSYTVTVTDDNGCETTEQVVVTVNELPTAVAGDDVEICEGESATLTASGGESYVWSNGATTPSITVSPTTTTNYTVTVTNNKGCADTDEVQVIVNSNPIANAGSDKTICEGESVTLTATGGPGYLWSNGETTASITVSPSTTSTYTVTVTTSKGCTDTDEVIVTVNQNPIANVNNETICAGETATLTASGGISYLWSNGATSASISVSPNTTTVYTVEVSNSQGCTDEADATVTVNPSPSLTINDKDCRVFQGVWDLYFTSDAEQVSVLTGTLTSLGNNEYKVADIDVFNNITLTLNNTTTGCSKVEEIVAPNCLCPEILPPTSGGDREICLGDRIPDLSVSVVGSLIGVNWYDAPVNGNLLKANSLTYEPTEAGTFYAESYLLNLVSCVSGRTPVSLTIRPRPIVSAGDDQTICNGESVTLTATGVGSFEWNTGDTTASIVVSPTTTTTYTVTLTNEYFCQESDEVTVTVNDTPTVTASEDQETCGQETVSISAAASGGNGPYNFIWNNGLGEGQNKTVSPLITTTYIVTVTDDNGCKDTDEVTVVVNPQPSVDAGNDVTICEGESTTLSALAANGTPNYTYSWNNGLGNGASKTVSPEVTTTYEVTVTDANGCTTTDNVTVNVDPSFMSGINGPETRCAAEGVLFAASPAVSGATYNWTFSGPATPSNSNSPSQVVTWSAEGTYNVTLVVSKGSCIETYSQPIVITEEVFAAAGPDKDICQGASTVIGGSPTGPSDATYLWTPNLFLNDVSSANPTATPPSTLTYTVQVTKNGCTRTSSVTVNVDVELNPKPEAGPDKTICDGESVQIGNSPAIPNVNYEWSTEQGTIPSSNASVITVNPSTSTKYYVVATNQYGCIGVDSVVVNVNPTPEVNAGADDAICAGESIDLQASATNGTPNYTYVWDNGLGVGAAHTVLPVTTTTYTVTVTDANGCASTDQVTITVNENPIADAGTNISTCGVETVTLSASASGGTPNYTYVWDNGLGAGATHTVNPTQTTVYTVTVTDANGCTDTDEVRVTVNQVPTVSLGNDSTICNGQSITLTANVSGGLEDYEFLWSNGETTESISVNPSAVTTYSVTVTDANGCQNSDQVTISVDPSFTSGINAPNTRCAGEGVLFAVDPVVPGATYEWFFNGPATPSSSTDPSVVVTWASPGIYGASLEVTRGACTESYDHPINITQEVFAAAGPDKTICQGASTQIGGSPTGPAGSNYSWSPNFFMNSTTVSNPVVTPPVTTTYTVQVTQNGCVNTASVTVYVDIELNPKPEAGPDQEICAGESVTIGGPADPNAIFQQWSTADGDINGAFEPYLTVSPTETTKYYVTAYNQLGCPGVDSVIVTVNPNPTANAGEDKVICPGEEVILTASASGGEGPYEYLWSNGESTESITVSPSSTTTYTVTVTDANGCKDTDEAIVNAETSACASIGDFVWEDLDGDGIQDTGEPGIEGVTVNLLDENGNPTGQSTTTDANGAYEFTGLAPGTYSVEFETPAGYTASPANQGGDDTVDSDADPVTGETAQTTLESGENDPTLDAGFYQPASIGDFVFDDLDGDGIQDAGEPGIEGVVVNLLDGNGNPTGETTTTGPNGEYEFTDLVPGDYIVEFEAPTGSDFSPADQGGDDATDSDANPTTGQSPVVTLESGDNVDDVDAGLITPASIGDFVWEDLDGDGIQNAGEPGIEGVTVNLLDENGNPTGQSTTTDANGAYEFTGLAPGTYSVEFETPAGYTASPANQGGDDATDSDADPVTGETAQTTLASGENDPTLDAGFYQPASIGDFVFDDLDGDGIQDAGEPGIEGVVVNLLDGNGNPTGETTTTGPNGEYEFTDLVPGDYIVEFEAPNGYTTSPADQGGDDATDSDANPTTGQSPVVTLESGDNVDDVDAGLITPASIGDFVWEDLDGDGIQDIGEPGIEGVTVNLLDENGNPTGQSTTTDANGAYEFTGLTPGTYSVDFETPSGYTASPANQGGDDATDSDADPVSGETAQTTLESGENDPTLDAGFYQPASIGDFVFDDLDGDGIQDAGEPGIEGVVVNLLDGNGNPTGETTTTGPNGEYEFTDLVPGDYIVEFEAPTGSDFSPADQGGDDATDSDANPTTGQSPVVTLESGDNVDDVDAGLITPASIGDFVWEDLDGDGIQDTGEPGIEGVTVNLLDENGNPTGQSTTTDANGAYEFTGLAPGTYSVEFETPAGYTASPANQGGDDTVDSDADPVTGETAQTTLASGENDPTLDAGFYQPASIGDFVFDDLDGDGIQDAGEPGIEGVVVNLLDGNGNPTGETTTTGPNGEYEFTDLVPGDYIVEFEAPNGYTTSPADQGGNDATDSDANPTTGQSPVVTLESGDNVDDVDAGYSKNCSVDVTASDVEVCSGSDVTITAVIDGGVADFTYSWSTGQSSASFVANPTITTTYTVVITDAIGCESTDSVQVTVNPNPVITPAETVCEASLLTYSTGFTIDIGTATATPGTLVNNGGGSYSVTNVPVGQNVEITATSPEGCITNETITSPNCVCPDVNIPTGVDSIVACDNKPLPTLVVFVNAGSTVDWYTTATGGSPIALNTTSYQPIAPGIYYAEARGIINNCTSVERLKIEVTTIDCKDCPTPDCLRILISE